MRKFGETLAIAGFVVFVGTVSAPVWLFLFAVWWHLCRFCLWFMGVPV